MLTEMNVCNAKAETKIRNSKTAQDGLLLKVTKVLRYGLGFLCGESEKGLIP